MGISDRWLGVELRVSPPTVNDIVLEKRGITAEMAARLAKYFGTSEQFWLNLPDAFAVHQVKKRSCTRSSGPSSPLPQPRRDQRVSIAGTVTTVDGARELPGGCPRVSSPAAVATRIR
jgi:addiction module HigA family antidote